MGFSLYVWIDPELLDHGLFPNPGDIFQDRLCVSGQTAELINI